MGVAAGAAIALGRMPAHAHRLETLLAQTQLPLITKPIPSSGERIPVVGVGTRSYSPSNEEERARMCNVVRTLAEHGCKVIDTARGYGRSEETLGQCIKELGNRDQLFLATKFSVGGGRGRRGGQEAAPQDPRAGLEMAFTRLQTDRVDLMMVWNLGGTDVLLPVMRELKQAGRFRYIGVSTSSDNQYDALAQLMRNETLDFIQIDFAIDNRLAAQTVLPLAAERGIAVMVNLPFGRERAFQRVEGRPLPDWAAEIEVKTWPQYLLKYVVSHPAVTVAIPGTTNPVHMADNAGAARGQLPDAAMRQRMEAYYDSIGT
jgi:aryl-alcohol dehydrogenase-like predicted oxidoreductase